MQLQMLTYSLSLHFQHQQANLCKIIIHQFVLNKTQRFPISCLYDNRIDVHVSVQLSLIYFFYRFFVKNYFTDKNRYFKSLLTFIQTF